VDEGLLPQIKVNQSRNDPDLGQAQPDSDVFGPRLKRTFFVMTLGILTLGIMALGIMTLGIMSHNIKSLCLIMLNIRHSSKGHLA